MSFASLFGGRSEADETRVTLWEHLFLEIQVLLAYADDNLDPSERMTLSVLSLARDDEGNLKRVDETIGRIEKEGFVPVARDVMGRARETLAEELEELRPKIAKHILKRSLSVVAADGVVSSNERSFVLNYMAPSLSLDREETSKTLDKLDRELSTMRVYVERAFEIYVMLIDADEHHPTLNSRDGEPLSGFLGAVDELVIQRSLGSSQAIAYFLSALGGTLWVDQYRTYVNYFSRLSVQVRELRKTSGLEGRLGVIRKEIEQVKDRGQDPFAFKMMQRHVLNALNKLSGMSEKQIVLFRDQIAPTIDLQFEELLRSLEGKPTMVRLLHNLQGARPLQRTEDSSWWKFWT